jgi:hypothetical protein
MSTVTQDLLSAAPYSILAYSGVTNSVAGTTISGGLIGSYPTNTITLTGGWTLSGGAAVVTATAQNQTDLANAIAYFQGLTPVAISASYATHTFTATATGYNGAPGFVGFASSTLLFTGGTITLDGANLANPVFVFQVGTALNVTTAATTISLINGATAANVVWVVGSSATFDAHDHVFAGSILAHTSITTNATTAMVMNGRLLANTGAVTISNPLALTIPAGSIVAPGPNITIVPGSGVSSISQRYEEKIGLLTITATSYTTGGVQGLDAALQAFFLTTSPNLIWIELHSTTGSGFIYQRTNVPYTSGSPAVTTVGALKILVVGAAGSPAYPADSLVELGAGALPAGVVNDVIAFRVTYNRNIPAYVGVVSPY